MVRGASSVELGVWGDVITDKSSWLLVLGLFVSESAGRAVEVMPESLEPRLERTVFPLSPAPKKAPNVFPLLDGFMDARSGLRGGLSFFRDPDVKTSLILVPGDIPRPVFEAADSARLSNGSLCRESNVVACCGARFVPVGRLLFAMGNVVDFCARDGCAGKLSNLKLTAGSFGLEVLIKGDEDVR